MSIETENSNFANRVAAEFNTRRAKSLTVDLGTDGVFEKLFQQNDADISATDIVELWQVGQAETAENSDERISVIVNSTESEKFFFTISAMALGQKIRGVFNLAYRIK